MEETIVIIPVILIITCILVLIILKKLYPVIVGNIMKKIKKIILLSIIIIILIVATFWTIVYYQDKNAETKFDYSVKISGSNGNFSMFVPFPIFKEPENEIYKNLQFDYGTGSYKIQNTEYGTALNISSSEDFKLISLGVGDKDIWHYHLTMRNSTKVYKQTEYYAFSSSNDTINISLKFEILGSHSSESNTLNGKISEGWNIIMGTSSASQE
jgi:hypothetical protein